MKRTILILLVLLCGNIFSQRRYVADRFFEEFSYKKSAELYEMLYKKGDSSQVVLGRLGDSYYFNGDFKHAEFWYDKLFRDYRFNKISPEHIFRYSQVLKSNGNVKESDKWLLNLRKVKKGDRRSYYLDKNRDYFSAYTQKKKFYIDLHNLSLNTKYSDFGGFSYGGRLYFSSTRPQGNKEDLNIYQWNGQPFLNIYSVKENYDSINREVNVSDIEEFPIINTKYHESNIVISPDGNTIYFTRDNFDGKELKGDNNRVSHLKIYSAKKEGGVWGSVKELPINDDSYSCGHPSLSLDGKTLYFVSDMPGGYGLTDLYSVSILGGGIYGEVKNLGKNINTEGREMFPYVGIDNNLYFSSDGHLGLGALDIFEVNINNLDKGDVLNLGAPINSPKDDFSFVLCSDLERGFFSSNRLGGKGDDDIYSFVLKLCSENISGYVRDKLRGDLLSGVTVRLLDSEGKELSRSVTGSEGYYIFKSLACKSQYNIVVSKDDYRSDRRSLFTTQEIGKTIFSNFDIESLILKDQIVIKPIYFDYDLYNIRSDAEYELEHIVSVLKNHPDMVIRIESHTDSRGSKIYNKRLSDRRAKSTESYLLSRGISRSRIESARGYGESQLLNNCDDLHSKKCTEAEHQINRRSYFYIVKGGDNVKSSMYNKLGNERKGNKKSNK